MKELQKGCWLWKKAKRQELYIKMSCYSCWERKGTRFSLLIVSL
uniref:Cleavage and polyadenylation specificity factor subunit 3-II n=1 Tax=Rhizophora mucronata TaxID=61149 RepID=A0A2P2KNC4_RHIMU